MKKKQSLFRILYIVAVILIIVSACIHICNLFVQPPEGVVSSNTWQYIVSGISFIDLIIVATLQVIQFKDEKNSYLNKNLMFTKQFCDYIEEKNNRLYSMKIKSYPEEVLKQGLQVITKWLQGYIGKKYHYEVSIFTNAKEPYIYAYYDTYGNNVAASHNMRNRDPEYYIKKQYEVVELLRTPSSELFVIPSTIEKINYKFATEEQKQKVKSQIMYCFHMNNPYVLVISCNKEKSFKINDHVLEGFIRNIGMMLNSDILIKERMCR